MPGVDVEDHRYHGPRLYGRRLCDYTQVHGRDQTDVTVFPDGRFTLTTTNRGEAASRWVAQIQGKKIVRPVPPGGEPEPEPGE